MIISVHQPQYLPWLGYFHKMYQSDAFVFLDNVQYKKREYQNRNRIRTKSGGIWLTVPVLSEEASYPKISSVRIDNSQVWQKRHWRAISLNYGRAPYFKKYNDYFEGVFKKEWKRLADLNIHITKYVAQSLGIDRPVYLESQLNITTKNTTRIIDICRTLGADMYFSGIGGREYLDEKQFDLNGIKLLYQDFAHPKYLQRYKPFIPCMSIIDLMFNCGDDSLRILLSGGKRLE